MLLAALLLAPAAALRAPVPRCCASPSPPPVLALAQGAMLRTFGGAAAGAAAGSAAHAALPASGLLDGVLNVVDVSGGLLIGLILGVLWGSESLLLGSGVVGSSVRQAISIVGEERDRAAGERLLADVRSTLDALRQVEGVQGVILRVALDLFGVTSDAGVAKLAEAAEAARREQRGAVVHISEVEAPDAAPEHDQERQSLAGVLAAVVEAKLEAILFDLRAALVVAAVFLIGSIDALLLLFNGLGS